MLWTNSLAFSALNALISLLFAMAANQPIFLMSSGGFVTIKR